MRLLGAIAVAALVLSGQTAVAAPAPVRPDPLLAFLEDPGQADVAEAARAREARTRARVLSAPAPAYTYAEREPASVRGRNDSPWTAESTEFRRHRAAVFTGSLLADPTMPTVGEFAEPNDTQGSASDSGVGTTHRAIRTTGRITGQDADFYRLHGAGLTTIATRTDGSDLDTVLTVFDAAGKEIAASDTVGASTDARLEIALADAEYFVRVTGAQNTAGAYELTLAAGEGKGDKDFFAVDLKAGDVIGASVAGAARRVAVHDISGREVMGSSQDFSGVYPKENPLPGGGNAVADFLAPRDGRYHVGVEDGAGRYELTVKAFRPGSEKAGPLTVFVDFDGALVDTSGWGSPGEKQLSPLSKFLANWGLSPQDENAVVSVAVDTVRENLALHGKFGVRLLNSRDHADPWGRKNVSRLVIGGTIAESGVQTVAIAQSIDPGNFGLEETAMVQLDLLSQLAGPPVSLNSYLRPGSDKVRFVGRALGNIAAHELGHLSGSWHQHQFNEHDTLMDQGGNPAAMFAVGADGIGGNADDPDMDFGEDHFVPNEGFIGLEDAAARTRWGYHRG